MKFYLGTHVPTFFCKTDVPLFLSRRILHRRKSHHKAKGPWALDSGGFTELSMFGKWTTGPEQYIDEVRLFKDKIGNMDWASIQDWMCEPHILKNTGKSVKEHQKLTVSNYLHLLEKAPDIQWTPVVQGWTLEDYLSHVKMYAASGVLLERLPVVGCGSVCRRQHSDEIYLILQALKDKGLNLHGFGIKTRGLIKSKSFLVSADSMSWSFTARMSSVLPEHEGRHKNCANCFEFAMKWRENLIKKAGLEDA